MSEINKKKKLAKGCLIYKLEIAYKNKKGVKVYPDTYKINSQLVLSYPYPTMTRKNVNLKIIPIKDLEVYDG